MIPTLLALSLLASGGTAATDDDPAPKAAPPLEEWIDSAVDGAAAYLLGTQENYQPDRPVGRLRDNRVEAWQTKEKARLAELFGGADAAEWPYEGVHRVRDEEGRGVIPPGYRVGGTAIVVEALLAAAGEDGPDEDTRAAIERSLAFVLDALETNAYLERGPKEGYDVRGWGHTYGLRMLDVLRSRGLVPETHRERVDALIPELVKHLEVNQTRQGGWNYARDEVISPFMTASTLLTLFDAASHGVEVPDEMIERALDGLERGRTDARVYAYSGRKEPALSMHASCARSAAAELALLRAGRGDVAGLRLAIDGFFDGWEHLLVRKGEQGTHVPPYNIAPYYFFFGHTYAAYAIEELPEDERPARRTALAELLRKTQDADGSWNERVFPRTSSYSTAMTILALRANEAGRFAEWSGDAEAPSKAK